MLNIELAKKIQRAKAQTTIACLQGADGIREITLSFLALNPVTNQRYWQPPVPIQNDEGTFLVTISEGEDGASIESVNEDGIHLMIPHAGERVPAHVPYDYLYQIECFDQDDQIVYFDMLPILLDPEEFSEPQQAPVETKRPHLRLVHG